MRNKNPFYDNTPEAEIFDAIISVRQKYNLSFAEMLEAIETVLGWIKVNWIFHPRLK